MWRLVRQHLKMGMLKLAKHTPPKIEPCDGAQALNATNARAKQLIPEAAPKATGFAARREKLMGDSASK
jgi:hypothetical protein